MSRKYFIFSSSLDSTGVLDIFFHALSTDNLFIATKFDSGIEDEFETICVIFDLAVTDTMDQFIENLNEILMDEGDANIVELDEWINEYSEAVAPRTKFVEAIKPIIDAHRDQLDMFG